MKEEQLMINDLVTLVVTTYNDVTDKEERSSHPAKITDISPNCSLCGVDGDCSIFANFLDGYDEASYDFQIEPIPLSEEILVANGFKGQYFGELITDDWLIQCDCKHVRGRNKNGDENFEFSISYVHELQRALRCCGLWDLANNLRFPAQMQEMVYTTERQFDVLHSGIYSGYEFFIVSYGTHPCFYIAFPDGHRYGSMNITAIESSPVLERGHGGLSFRGTISALSANKYLLGWDYNHAGDYNPLLCLSGRKYSVQEILDDVRRMIDLICREDSEVSSNFI